MQFVVVSLLLLFLSAGIAHVLHVYCTVQRGSRRLSLSLSLFLSLSLSLLLLLLYYKYVSPDENNSQNRTSLYFSVNADSNYEEQCMLCLYVLLYDRFRNKNAQPFINVIVTCVLECFFFVQYGSYRRMNNLFDTHAKTSKTNELKRNAIAIGTRGRLNRLEPFYKYSKIIIPAAPFFLFAFPLFEGLRACIL